MGPISQSCPALVPELAQHLDAEYGKVQKHYLLSEWDDLLVDSGRMCEAILRYLEWKMAANYTPIDGRSKPNRSSVIGATRRGTSLDPSLRLQIPALVEILMDFRNNRNAAHLGNIDPNVIDSITCYQMLSWVFAEIIRLESNLPACDIQAVLDKYAERPVPVVYKIDGTPIVLSADIDHRQEVLVLLYDAQQAVELSQLFKWVHHTNITRWRKTVLRKLEDDRYIQIIAGSVHLLPPGMRQAELVLANSSDSNS